jgi:hypothetical protein
MARCRECKNKKKRGQDGRDQQSRAEPGSTTSHRPSVVDLLISLVLLASLIVLTKGHWA